MTGKYWLVTEHLLLSIVSENSEQNSNFPPEAILTHYLL